MFCRMRHSFSIVNFLYRAQTRVVLIPSQNDFHHHQLYPQPPFSDEFKHPYRREANIVSTINAFNIFSDGFVLICSG